jgi:hypothetical protein
VPVRASKTIAALAAGSALAAVIAGCGSTDRDDVHAKVKQFLQATSSKDYKTLCAQVLAPTLIERVVAGGLACEQAMQIALGPVQNPTLSIGRITVKGPTASAITLTGASGQQSSLDAIQLVKTSQGWRVASLGSPAVAPVKP